MEKISLKAARINKKLSAREAAEYAGISEDTLYRYESGKSSPQIVIAIKLAELYGISIDKIDFPMSECSE